MIDNGDGTAASRSPGLVAPRRAVHGAGPELRMTPALAAQELAGWAGGLADLMRAQIREAERRDLVSAAEADQLLARLIAVLDQAVTPVRVTPVWAP
jgi:hypothetical protein